MWPVLLVLGIVAASMGYRGYLSKKKLGNITYDDIQMQDASTSAPNLEQFKSPGGRPKKG